MKLLQLDKCHQRNNKRGGMLVIVLMIFAVSLILISSAMTITLSSRSRYYADTERSQERLTLTCAAEAVIDAIQMQEITDDQLVNLSKNPTKPLEITGSSKTYVNDGAKANSGKKIAPGLTNDDDKSKTLMYVKPAGGGSKDLILEFSTKINVTNRSDAKAENLTVYLEYFDPPKVKICANMVTLGDKNSSNTVNRLWAIGDGYDGQEGSFMVFHGNSDNVNETYSRTPVVFTGKVASGGAGTYFRNDVILYGPDACLDSKAAGGNGLQMGNNNIGFDEGGVFFLGVGCEGTEKRQKIFSEPLSSKGNITTYGAFFYYAKGDLNIESTDDRGIRTVVKGYKGEVTNSGNSEVTVNLKTAGKPEDWKKQESYEIESTSKAGGVKLSQDKIDAYTKKINEKARAYLNSDALKTAANQKMPTPDAYEEKFISNPEWSVSTGTKYLDGTETDPQPAGKYEMHGEYSGNRVLNFDLKDGNATIYISDDTKLTNFRINVSNKYGNKLFIVIANGKKFEMSYGSEDMTAGLSSCDQRRTSINGKHQPCNISLQNYELYGQTNGADYRPKPGQAPAAVIIGLGKNTVSVDGGGTVCDAYVSLAGDGANASTFSVTGNALFYGRFESDKFDASSNVIGLDYCPSLDEDNNSEQPLTTHYRAKSYSYHY